MNKIELVDSIAEKTGLKKKDAEAALKAFIETVEETLKKDDKVQLVGFGTFAAKKRAARSGVNPRTGKKIKIAACKYPTFTAGRAFKDIVK